jgi:hypothetical protein
MTEMLDQIKYFIGDREIIFNAPTQGQLGAAAKLTQLIKRKPEESIVIIAKILSIIDAMMTNDDDREYTENLMIEGQLDVDDLVKVLGSFLRDDEQVPKNGPKSRARRTS